MHTGHNIRLKLIFGVFILSFCFFQSFALDPDRPVRDYALGHWNIAHGLSSSNIRSITQTPDGYLWLATNKGLVMFDGVKFTAPNIVDLVPPAARGSFEKPPLDPTKLLISRRFSLKSTYPDTLFTDKEGVLWIGSGSGLTSYRYKTRQFASFSKKDGLTGDRLWRIYEDKKGNLWLGFYVNYLNRFEKGGSHPHPDRFTVFNSSHGLEGSMITSITEDKQGNVLVGTYNKGMFKFLREKFHRYEIEEIGTDHLVFKIYTDREGSLWIGTNKGLFRVIKKTVTVYTAADGLANSHITDITEDSDGNLWVGTVNGLTRLKKKPAANIVFDTLLTGRMVTCLFEDREKNLWVGTEDSGLIRLKNPVFVTPTAATSFIDKRKGEIILSLYEDRRGNTWIGSNMGRLHKYNNEEFIQSQQITKLHGTDIATIMEDSKGNLWLGTLGEGVFQRKGETFINFTTRDGLADNNVFSIFEDSNNNLWFSTNDGVARYRDGVFKSFEAGGEKEEKPVYKVYEDKNHNFWLAAEDGLKLFKKGDFSKTNRIDYLQDIPVEFIYEDGDVFWIGTNGGGLKRFKDGKFTSYTTADGMSSDYIYHIFEDEKNNFWMKSGNGVLTVGKEELNRFAQGRTDKVDCTYFGIQDGMKTIVFVFRSCGSSTLEKRNGELWHVTGYAITSVHPEKFIKNKTPPPVIIETAVFDDRSIPLPLHREKIVFREVRDLEFRFTAPTLTSPEKVKFKYRLEGFDKGWVFLKPGLERAARYEDLTEGMYTFRVIAGTNDGAWNRDGDSLSFIIKPVFYKTTIFKIALLFVFLAFVAAGYSWYKKRPVKEEKKHKTSSLNPIFAKECLKKLTYLMETEKLYRDEDISLQFLAEKLSVSLHQLSQLINENFNRSFPDFINTYRIEEAKKRLADPKTSDQNILSIAFDVGFNSRGGFNSVFKKHTGMTPSEFRDKTETT